MDYRKEIEEILFSLSRGHEPGLMEREKIYETFCLHTANMLDGSYELLASAKSVLSNPVGERDILFVMGTYRKSIEILNSLLEDWKSVEPFAVKALPLHYKNPNEIVREQVGFFEDGIRKLAGKEARMEIALKMLSKK